ncbi:hypothetical protein [Nitrospirillum iridis]|uniref:Uncharacterized protein n=1 Tax=Nitrospirillum iridis TaxID=765888 RepID=A0A7X0AW56_9PROT|nr:hypothetical protein [Nitrospirillum iridis]MBB6251224.1 hypothetical protein [Nitrospirillum iridis]
MENIPLRQVTGVAWRVAATLVVTLTAGAVGALVSPSATRAGAAAAGRQFQASDGGAVSFATAATLWSLPNILIMGVAAVLLFLIWRRPLAVLVRHLATLSAVAGLMVASLPNEARAYYNNSDRTEAYTILPNESAFWIPDIGDNKDGQVQYDSEAYLTSHKVALKRFIIPHHKLANSGGYIGWDAYVPDGRLIIVDRSPYSREWVSSAQRGTSSRDEGIHCQSKEGLDVTVGVSVAASVSETNAARFLYHFGVQQQGYKGIDRTDPNVIFTSVFYGRSLGDVMDDVGRKKIGTLICAELTARPLNAGNAEAGIIMDKVTKEAATWFATMGITLEFLGWADTFQFDATVQKAINDAYIATTVAGSLPVLQALADVRVKEGLGDGLRTRGLPASLVAVPDRLLGALGGMFGKGDAKPDAAPSK